MRFRPKYKKQVSLPVDIGRLTNHQQVGLPAPVNWTPMRYNGSKSRTQLERVSNEDEANKERDFAKEEDAGKDSSSADDCAQVGLQLRTIADTWNRTYFENVGDNIHLLLNSSFSQSVSLTQ